MKKILAACFLFFGCDNRDYKWVYQSGCVEYRSVLRLDEGKLDSYTNLAQEFVDAEYGEGTMCKTMVDSPVFVRQAPWPCVAYETGCAGEMMGGSIAIAVTEGSLVHEIFHKIEYEQGVVGTAWHENWDANGMRPKDLNFKRVAPQIWYQW